MLELGLKSLLAYLLGSVAGALVLGQLGGFDIRAEGSGNAGATNALRTRGASFAAGVLLIDLAKGWVAAALVPRLGWPAADPAVAREWLGVACAGAVVLGHVWPVWYGFRGGKGAATLLGALAGLCAGYVVPVFVVWLAVLYLTGYVGLSTMLAAASQPRLCQTGRRSVGEGAATGSPTTAARTLARRAARAASSFSIASASA